MEFKTNIIRYRQIPIIASLANFTNISILNSKHTIIALMFLDTVIQQNILIQNSTLNTLNIERPIIYLNYLNSAFVNNMTVKDSSGPMINFKGVFSKVITNSYFENVSNSMQMRSDLQFQISMTESDLEKEPNQKTRRSLIQNVNLNVRVIFIDNNFA